ncbi:MAG: hypothetical protein Edafosvirus9_35 [Edafosvirus sp.]|uniref:Uncharacterized protein n=1 Tax=Edafosvirus sp. TaxID=2487765 RepID=A0A3G4ZWF7_9VIRU|nr:MAG: hypothetical protein Edafosvirus9_35 [Edafosvirus sp.]
MASRGGYRGGGHRGGYRGGHRGGYRGDHHVHVPVIHVPLHNEPDSITDAIAWHRQRLVALEEMVKFKQFTSVRAFEKFKSDKIEVERVEKEMRVRADAEENKRLDDEKKKRDAEEEKKNVKIRQEKILADWMPYVTRCITFMQGSGYTFRTYIPMEFVWDTLQKFIGDLHKEWNDFLIEKEHYEHDMEQMREEAEFDEEGGDGCDQSYCRKCYFQRRSFRYDTSDVNFLDKREISINSTKPAGEKEWW